MVHWVSHSFGELRTTFFRFPAFLANSHSQLMTLLHFLLRTRGARRELHEFPLLHLLTGCICAQIPCFPFCDYLMSRLFYLRPIPLLMYWIPAFFTSQGQSPGNSPFICLHHYISSFYWISRIILQTYYYFSLLFKRFFLDTTSPLATDPFFYSPRKTFWKICLYCLS